MPHKLGLPLVQLPLVNQIDFLLLEFAHQGRVDRVELFLQRDDFSLNRLQKIFRCLPLTAPGYGD